MLIFFTRLKISDIFAMLICREPECEGCQAGQLLDVFCVFFNSAFYVLFFWCLFLHYLEIEKKTFCSCKDMPIQLMNIGLFPSAPLFPMLAEDLQVLDFVQELFVHAASNVTACVIHLNPSCLLGVSS